MEKLAAMEPVVHNEAMQEAVITSADRLRKEGRKAGVLRAVATYFNARFPRDESWEKRLSDLGDTAIQKLGQEFPNIASEEQLEAWLRDHSGA